MKDRLDDAWISMNNNLQCLESDSVSTRNPQKVFKEVLKYAGRSCFNNFVFNNLKILSLSKGNKKHCPERVFNLVRRRMFFFSYYQETKPRPQKKILTKGYMAFMFRGTACRFTSTCKVYSLLKRQFR